MPLLNSDHRLMVTGGRTTVIHEKECNSGPCKYNAQIDEAIDKGDIGLVDGLFKITGVDEDGVLVLEKEV